MNTTSLLPYSYSLMEDGVADFATDWRADDVSPHNLEHQIQCPAPVTAEPNDRLDSEDNRTVITESMSVTVSDEEKLQLLNKNTELRRLNAELMKLNQQWDEIYRNTTQRMQHTVHTLQEEVHNLRQHSDKLSLMLEHEQNKREFYEKSLLQEMKRNQKLQEAVRHLEKALHYKNITNRGFQNVAEISRPQNQEDVAPSSPPVSNQCPENPKESPINPDRDRDHAAKNRKPVPDPQQPCKNLKSHQYSRSRSLRNTESEQDMTQLKEQLQALKCQTEIYEADYKTEHTDRERMKTENEKLRKKEREMREQMLILQEQLKIYEDDFQRERSDKQVLQRLLKSRHSAREPVLVHRCNNEAHLKGPLGGAESMSHNSSRKEQKVRGEEVFAHRF
ncbi:TNFAIP3-interacting protein 3-like isoform X2 [Pelobates fuscus]|uniref:TNFAIP3-interacting protein 3-like isoform X2 n=1 Tax=Pelobates fuscus TaxID=191477 RepID=UPI002FE4CBBC